MKENTRVKVFTVVVAVFFVLKDTSGAVLYFRNRSTLEQYKLSGWLKYLSRDEKWGRTFVYNQFRTISHTIPHKS